MELQAENDLVVQLEHNMELSSMAQRVKLVGAALNFSVCRWPVNLALEEVQVELLPFWVQIHGIPLGFTSERNVRRLVRDVGAFLELEDLSKARRFVRVQVVVNSKNPLIPGCWLRLQDFCYRCGRIGHDTDTWVEFKYERLQDFCYRCGRIGHANTECSFEPQNVHAAGYGDWTKAAPIRDVVVPTRRVASRVGECRVAGVVRQTRLVTAQVCSKSEPIDASREGDRGAGRLLQCDSPPSSSRESKRWRRKEESHVSFPSSLGGCSAIAVEELHEGVIGEEVASPVKRGIMEEVGELSQVPLKKIKIIANTHEVCEVMEAAVEKERVTLLDRNEVLSSTGGGGWPLTVARLP
ncbi:hypothetical protein PS1_028019 [Malus domestica]